MTKTVYHKKKLRLTKDLYDRMNDYIEENIKKIKNCFSKNLKDLRKEKMITQTELSKNVGIPISIISLYENKKRMPTIETLTELGKYFNVSIEFLLGETNIKDDYNKDNKISVINSQTDLIIEVWRNYLDKQFDLKGYFSIIGKTINSSDMLEEIQVIFHDKQLKDDIEIKLEELNIKHRNDTKDFYTFIYVTAELLEKFLIKRQ